MRTLQRLGEPEALTKVALTGPGVDALERTHQKALAVTAHSLLAYALENDELADDEPADDEPADDER